jgi:hypothetical protein
MQAAPRGGKPGNGTRIELLDRQKPGQPPAVLSLTGRQNRSKATSYPIARTARGQLAAGNHPFTETADIGAVAAANLRFAL